MTDEPLETLLADLHDHLAATAERPVERDASRWLGEAEAVAGDLVEDPPPREVVHRRAGHVRDLLSNVDDTGDEAADERVSAAKDVLAEVLART